MNSWLSKRRRVGFASGGNNVKLVRSASGNWVGKISLAPSVNTDINPITGLSSILKLDEEWHSHAPPGRAGIRMLLP
jgi:hypothetical protein